MGGNGSGVRSPLPARARRQARRADPATAKQGHDGQSADVVGNREREQEGPRRPAHPGSEQVECADGQGDIGSHRDPLPEDGGGAPCEEKLDECWNQHPADGAHGGEGVAVPLLERIDSTFPVEDPSRMITILGDWVTLTLVRSIAEATSPAWQTMSSFTRCSFLDCFWSNSMSERSH